MRAVFIGPVIAFFITRRWCISLQRHDSDTLLHGYETGVIMRSPEGGYTEKHLPVSPDRGLHAHRARPRPGRPTLPAETGRQRRRRAGHARIHALRGQARRR